MVHEGMQRETGGTDFDFQRLILHAMRGFQSVGSFVINLSKLLNLVRTVYYRDLLRGLFL